MEKKIAIIRGDGIGPEIITEALRVLDAVAERFGHQFTYIEAPMGGNAYNQFGSPLPQSSIDKYLSADSVLMSSIGGPEWDNLPKEMRPETGLLQMRDTLGLYANIRPAKLFPQLREACPLKDEIIDKGIDFVVVRELIGGAYFGEHKTETVDGEEHAHDIMAYATHEIERIAHIAFTAAQKRRKKVCSVDKANVLDSSRLWRRVVNRIAEQYSDVELSHMYVDNCAMQIVRDPSQFDVILTENLFGDILSDEASMVTGSIGLIPSSSMGGSGCGLYEPIHGSAPDIAGTGKANPIGTILAAAMMLKYSFDMPAESQAVEDAVEAVLSAGLRTADIAADQAFINCEEMGTKICEKILAE